jgi:hypothetical protein
LRISFCDRCGDFFARSDSLERHHRDLPAECPSVTFRLEEAVAIAKRMGPEKAHHEFWARSEGF